LKLLQPGATPQAYRLQLGSAALGGGIAVPDNGAVDYYQDALTTPPSIGAYSGNGVENTNTLVTLSDLRVSE
jgi:hypothetical protein